MWGRKSDPGPTPQEIPDLDEQIRRVRAVVATSARPETVGALVTLLTVRATVASMADRHDDALEDRRAAVGLLRGFEGQASPVDRSTSRLAWMGAAVSERRAGDLDAALDAAVHALDVMGPPMAEDVQMCAAFLQDLDDLRKDLRVAQRRDDVVRAAGLMSDLATRLAERDEAAYAGVLGFALVNEAAARANAGDLGTAAPVNEEAIRLLQEHAPTSTALTTALSNRAAWQRRSGQWEEAVATEQLALAGVRTALPATRAEVERLNSLFLTLVRSGRRDEAEQTISEAVELSRRLVEDDPGQTSMLATLLGNQANLRGELHRYDEALASSEEALALRERLAATDPSRQSDQGLAMVLNNHAAVLRRVGRVEEAAASAARSVELRRRLAEDGTPSSIALLANALNSHAEQLGHLGDGERAVRDAEEARDLYAAMPPPGAVTRLLRANQETLGRVLAVAGRHQDAVVAAERAVELGRAAAAEAPGERAELAGCLESLAERLSEVGRGPQAESVRAEAARLRADEAS
jgi:tetratricopeptide (TPR) repeat protein